MQAKRIAFVYDWFDTEIGGAERVLRVFHEMFPESPWYTLHIDRKSVPWAKTWDIRPSFVQRLPLWFRKNRILTLILMPFAFESFDLFSYDLVISISSGFAKNVITSANTKHICYLLTPPRWLWKNGEQKAGIKVHKLLDHIFASYFRNWDRVGAQRVDEYISISQEVAKRCKEFYGRESIVIYPPFEQEYWKNLCEEGKTMNIEGLLPKSYFLVVSRLKKYKKIDLAIEAFRKFKIQKLKVRNKYQNIKLAIVGVGEELGRLKDLVKRLGLENEVIWLKNLLDTELAYLYKNTIALVMPQEEDFGYTACEAAACGVPVVCFNKGGQTEIIKNRENGVYFDFQNVNNIACALEEVTNFKYNLETYENSNIRGWSRHSFVAAFSQKIPKTV